MVLSYNTSGKLSEFLAKLGFGSNLSDCPPNALSLIGPLSHFLRGSNHFYQDSLGLVRGLLTGRGEFCAVLEDQKSPDDEGGVGNEGSTDKSQEGSQPVWPDTEDSSY